MFVPWRRLRTFRAPLNGCGRCSVAARRIVGTCVRVYCGNGQLEHAFRRDVQLRAADLEPFINRMRRLMAASLSR